MKKRLRLTRILVTAAGGGSFPSFVQCLRSGRGKMKIFSTILENTPISSAFVDHLLRIAPADSKNFISELLAVCQKHKIDVLIPTNPPELLPIALVKEKFEAAGTKVLVSEPAALRLADNKAALYKFAEDKKIPFPNYRVVNNFEGFARAARLLGFPGRKVCFKPAVSSGGRGFRILTRKAQSTQKELLTEKPKNTVAVTLKDAAAFFPGINKGTDILVMEYLPGKEYSVDALAWHGTPVAIVPRVRKEVVDGVSFIAEISRHRKIIQYSKSIIQKLNLHGIVGLQFKEDKNGQSKILEINPRAQGTIVATAGGGANIPHLAVRMALGKKIKAPKIKWGAQMFRYYGQVFFHKGRFYDLSGKLL